MSVAAAAQSRHVCVGLNCNHLPVKVGPSTGQTNPDRALAKLRGEKKKKRKKEEEEEETNDPITKAHRLVPAQLPSANEAPQSVPVAQPLRSARASTCRGAVCLPWLPCGLMRWAAAEAGAPREKPAASVWKEATLGGG